MREGGGEAEKYAKLTIKYLENAAEALDRGELEKASEFIWGAVAEALKCLLMAKRGIKVLRHAELRRMAREVAREAGDPEIYRAFAEAESLHSNFYEAALDKEDIAIRFESARRLVDILLSMAREVSP